MRHCRSSGGGTVRRHAVETQPGVALLPDPQLLLLDEPYAGFDWDTYQRFWSLTGERRDAGATVLIISHFIADEQRFDRIYQLVEGRVVQR